MMAAVSGGGRPVVGRGWIARPSELGAADAAGSPPHKVVSAGRAARRAEKRSSNEMTTVCESETTITTATTTTTTNARGEGRSVRTRHGDTAGVDSADEFTSEPWARSAARANEVLEVLREYRLSVSSSREQGASYHDVLFHASGPYACVCCGAASRSWFACCCSAASGVALERWSSVHGTVVPLQSCGEVDAEVVRELGAQAVYAFLDQHLETTIKASFRRLVRHPMLEPECVRLRSAGPPSARALELLLQSADDAPLADALCDEASSAPTKSCASRRQDLEGSDEDEDEDELFSDCDASLADEERCSSRGGVVRPKNLDSARRGVLERLAAVRARRDAAFWKERRAGALWGLPLEVARLVVALGDEAAHSAASLVSRQFLKLCEDVALPLFERLALLRFPVLCQQRPYLPAGTDFRQVYKRHARLRREMHASRPPAPAQTLNDFVFTLEVTHHQRVLLVANVSPDSPDDAADDDAHADTQRSQHRSLLALPARADLVALIAAALQEDEDASSLDLGELHARVICLKRSTGEIALLYQGFVEEVDEEQFYFETHIIRNLIAMEGSDDAVALEIWYNYEARAFRLEFHLITYGDVQPASLGDAILLLERLIVFS